MTPQFQALTEALGAERAQLTETTSSPDPELVAVFDVAGSVDRFLRACAQIPGLEFLADLQDDNANADEDFFYEAKDGDPSDNGVPTSLYMVMSNAQAVAELVRLFELWQADPKVTFERGLAPLKDVFGLLRSIRRWGVEDRVRETGLLEQWREDVANIGQTGTARVEIELWFRDNETDRQHAENRVVELLVAANASVIRTVVLPQIQFHGLLAEIPYDQVAAVVEHGPDHIALLSANAIMFVSPATTMALPSLQPSKNETISLGSRPAVGKPRVALLDGLPLAQHVAVQNRLVIDDPDDRGSRYGGGQHSHGTAMASLILHGDLADPGEPLSGPLYVRPIMQPHPWAPGRPEIVPEDELLIDLIHRAFLRMFEEEGTQPPASPGVRIVNLSIGDPARMFARRMSPLAKLVDWLSHKYNVLVVVSAGNHDHVLSIPWQAGDSSAALPGKAVRVLHAGARSRRLLSPAEAMNAITVGAQHSDSVAADLPDTVIDLFEQGGPAPYSSIGFGYRRSIKPDALLPGGRQIFQRPVDLEGASGLVELSPVPTPMNGPGLRVAAPGLSGSLDGTVYSAGSSNAAALATRTLDQILDVLEQAEAEDGAFEFPDPQYHPVLAKALLVHASGWGTSAASLATLLRLEPKYRRRDLTQILGYGAVDRQRVAAASRVRPVLLGASSITKDKRHTYFVPIPEAVGGTTAWRRATVTLAWLSPVNTRSQRHRMARLSFDPPRSELGADPTEAEHHAIFRGTVQHQVLEGKAAIPFVRGDTLEINVDCRVDAGKLANPVRYGLAVSIEMAQSVQADIHAQVRTGLRALVEQRVRPQV